MLTFLANLITWGTNATPYSMVTAAGPRNQASGSAPAADPDKIKVGQKLRIPD